MSHLSTEVTARCSNKLALLCCEHTANTVLAAHSLPSGTVNVYVLVAKPLQLQRLDNTAHRLQHFDLDLHIVTGALSEKQARASHPYKDVKFTKRNAGKMEISAVKAVQQNCVHVAGDACRQKSAAPYWWPRPMSNILLKVVNKRKQVVVE